MVGDGKQTERKLRAIQIIRKTFFKLLCFYTLIKLNYWLNNDDGTTNYLTAITNNLFENTSC
jgi:hypothetical protein